MHSGKNAWTIQILWYRYLPISTLLNETNIAPARQLPKRKLIFQPSIFRCYGMLVSERVIMMSLDQTFQHYLQHFPTAVGSIKFGFGEAIYLKQKAEISKSILQRTSGEPNSESSVHHSSFSWAILPKDWIPNQNTKGTLLCHTGQSSPVYPLQSSLAAFRTLQCCGM